MFLRPIAFHQGYITQDFGKTKFSQTRRKNGTFPYGLDKNDKPKPHLGVDFGSMGISVPVYACMDGLVSIRDSGSKGFGLHVVQRSEYKCLESIYGHLSKIVVNDGDRVSVGDIIGYTGNTGNSTAVHLHWQVSKLKKRRDIPDVFKWEIENKDDEFEGAFDPMAVEYRGKKMSLVVNHLGGSKDFDKEEFSKFLPIMKKIMV